MTSSIHMKHAGSRNSFALCFGEPCKLFMFALMVVVLFSSAMVFSAEMFNTAIENTCDYIEPKMDRKRVKIGSWRAPGAI